jgi:transcription initiation factor IIF auxiliary subunit
MSNYEFTSYSRSIGTREGYDLFAWCVFLDGNLATIQSVREIEYTLHPSFPDPIRTIQDPDHCFALLSQGWGEFPMRIRLKLINGGIVSQSYNLYLNSDSWPRGDRLQKFDSENDRKIYDALMEGETDWRKLSTVLRKSFVPVGEAKSTLQKMELQRAVRKAYFLSLDNEELWGATFRVGLLPEPKADGLAVL